MDFVSKEIEQLDMCCLVTVRGQVGSQDWHELGARIQALSRGPAKGIIIDWRASTVDAGGLPGFLEAMELERALIGTIVAHIGLAGHRGWLAAAGRLPIHTELHDSYEQAVSAVGSVQEQQRRTAREATRQMNDHDLEWGDLGAYGFGKDPNKPT